MWLTKLKKRVRPRERKRGRSARLPGNESEKYVTKEMGFCAKEALRFRLTLDVALGLVLGGGWPWVLPRGC